MARLSVVPKETYDSLARIRKTALVTFDSLFSPDRRIWTAQGLEQFREAFIDRFDVGEGNFSEKLRTQLDGASDDTIQLAAELIYVQQFFTMYTGMERKLVLIREVLSWSDRLVEIPDWAIAGLKRGLAGDQSFAIHRPFHLAWLDEFLIKWHTLEASERQSLLSDPWAFRELVLTTESQVGAYQPMRQAWLYMVFPDHYEAISSRKDKKRIVDGFQHLLENPPSANVDADLLEIRTKLTQESGEEVHFYRPPIIDQWRTSSKKAKRVPDPTSAGGSKKVPVVNSPGDGNESGPLNDRLLATGAELLLKPDSIMLEWSELLLDSKQIIFQGPPGTGKTFLARQLANLLTGDADRVTLVQFHPSYAYEDFVEGYRPSSEAGQFELRDGPLKRIANRARSDPDRRYVLLIDEINRGNLAKVFGELYFLLEYRSEAVLLQYSNEPFELPPNLLVMGTMNTADRSIALLDMALRRRFTFIDLYPDAPPIEGLLRRFLHKNAPDMAFLADMLGFLNRELDDRHSAVGPSHFLLKTMKELTEEKAERIWTHSVVPALADRFFDDPKALAEFTYEKVRSKSSPEDRPGVEEPSEDTDENGDLADAD